MKKISLRVLTLAALLTTAGLVLASTSDTSDNTTLNQIAGYRRWTRVTPKPVAVDLSSARLTTIPVQLDLASIGG